jgi:hypothetical protein
VSSSAEAGQDSGKHGPQVEGCALALYDTTRLLYFDTLPLRP